jgi:DNA invertase Pin-like site-specific DNA recombinase
MVRFVFYGRVSTEDWQDPVTSRARQREQAEALVRGHGQIVAEFFDVGQTRKLAWACRPQSAALVAQLADPDRGWDAIVIGETSGRSTESVRVDGAAARARRHPAAVAGGRRPRRQGARMTSS